MPLSSFERTETDPAETSLQTTNLIRQHQLNDAQMLSLVSDINPALGSQVEDELTNPQAAGYYQAQGILEFMLAGQLADAIISPVRLGKLESEEVTQITNIADRRPGRQRQLVTYTKTQPNAQSPPRLAK